MKGRDLTTVAAVAIGVILGSTLASSQSKAPTEGPAADGSPAWFLQGSFPDPTGRTIVDEKGNVTVPPRSGGPGRGAGANAEGSSRGSSPVVQVPPCRRSPICGRRGGFPRGQMQRVQWKQTLGYTFMYPIVLPPGFGGVPSVALDSKNNLWVFQRADVGKPQLFKFDPNNKLILQVGPEVIGYQTKAHGKAVDSEDNVWITAAGSATVMKISPEGKLLLKIGETGRRGDWDEAKGQRLLWEPVMVAFAPNGDVYIGEGHANESPNDADSDDPANNIGASRIIHLDKNGKFKNQWFGNEVGMGKFNSSHGLAVDPKTGDVWIGDREEYRIVVYSGDGKFLRTMQTRNLVCALNFDRHGNPWMASGQDGQFLKLTRDGKVIGAIGNGMGIGHGQFIEASYWVFDKDDNLWAGDTSVGRVTKMLAPKK
jgi:hypothetical protein